MTLQEIKKYTNALEKKEFQDVLFYILSIADSKYGMSLFTEDKSEFKAKLLQLFLKIQQASNKKETIHKTRKRKLKHIGSIDLQGSLDNVNIREFAYE
jgi:flavodoxin